MLHIYNKNPRYLALNGKPTVLVGSGEHYGALLNRAFDFETYFKTLGADELNQCRIFSGTYREIPGSFAIEDNNLAPKGQDFVCPYASTEDGKFDLSRWNEEYFTRLHTLMRAAGDNGVIVEFVLFCFWYNDALWKASPFHPGNNVQAVGPEDKEAFWQLDTEWTPYQEALVRKLVTELNPYENLYFELINEPYSRQDHTDYCDFQTHIAQVIATTETELANTHLVAMNVNNRAFQVTSLPEQVSIINFHYAQPEAVHLNYHLGKVLADDETGFAGQKNTPYRREAWRFMLHGGGAFSHLDYSFTTTHPDGTAPVVGRTPGFGGPLLRKQFAFLKRFLMEAAVWELSPAPELFAWNAGDLVASALAKRGERYAIYMAHSQPVAEFALAVPPGIYTLRWFDPVGCHELAPGQMEHKGGYFPVPVAVSSDEFALLLERESKP